MLSQEGTKRRDYNGSVEEGPPTFGLSKGRTKQHIQVTTNDQSWFAGINAMYVYVCTYYIYICTYMYVYVCTYVHMYVCTYVRMYVCTYVRMYVCMYVCIHIYIYNTCIKYIGYILQVLVDFPTNLNWCKLMQIPFVYIYIFLFESDCSSGSAKKQLLSHVSSEPWKKILVHVQPQSQDCFKF